MKLKQPKLIDEKYNVEAIEKIVEGLEKITNDKLMEIYANVDWDKFSVLNVGIIAAELRLRGIDIVEEIVGEDVSEDSTNHGICMLEFKPVEKIKKAV